MKKYSPIEPTVRMSYSFNNYYGVNADRITWVISEVVYRYITGIDTEDQMKANFKLLRSFCKNFIDRIATTKLIKKEIKKQSSLAIKYGRKLKRKY